MTSGKWRNHFYIKVRLSHLSPKSQTFHIASGIIIFVGGFQFKDFARESLELGFRFDRVKVGFS